MILKKTTIAIAATISIQAHALEIVIGAAGDFSFSDNHIRQTSTPPDVSPMGVWDHTSGSATYAQLTSKVTPLFWNSDLNFLNVETVIAHSKKGLSSPKAGGKGFAFIAHPEGLRHVVETMNVNLLSLANNHAQDFGGEGLRLTLENVAELERRYEFVHSSGLFQQGQPLAPIEFTMAGKRIAFAALNSGGGGGSGISLVGVTSNSYRKMVQAFKDSTADLKIMSVHYGVEGKVTLDPGQAQRFRYAVDHGGVNLILGHHPHVVRPVEIYKGSAIFYSLGNFLITGAANIDGRTSQGKPDHYRNYALFTRTYFEVGEGKAQVTAIEAHPLKGMHWQPRPATPQEGQKNISYLNRLNQEIGQTGVRFNIRTDGSGVYCSGQGHSGPRQSVICP